MVILSNAMAVRIIVKSNFSDLEEISRKRKWTCSETSVHQNHTSDIKELISNVTQKINANTDEENHEDSFNLDFDCDVAPAKKGTED